MLQASDECRRLRLVPRIEQHLQPVGPCFGGHADRGKSREVHRGGSQVACRESGDSDAPGAMISGVASAHGNQDTSSVANSGSHG